MLRAFARPIRPLASSPSRLMMPVTTPIHKGVRYNSNDTNNSEITQKLSQFSDDSSVTNLTSDQLGYLDSIGMAQGWGPTSIIESILELNHVYTGLPWWGTIVTTTIAVRLFMFPLYVKASANGAKMSKVKPQLDVLMQRMKDAESPQEQVEASYERKDLMKKHDVHMSHQFFPMLQLPIAYGFFQALRKMANFPVEGFSTQGYAWFEDLTQVDPYLGLQVISASVVLGMFRLGGETGMAALNPAMKKIMFGLPIISIFITKEFSAAVVLYFAVNSMFSFLQTSILKNKMFRSIMKLPQQVKPPVGAPGSNEAPQNLGDWWKEWNKNAKKSTNKRMEQSNKKMGAIQRRKGDVNKNFIKRH